MANNLTPKEEFLLNPVTEHNITDAAIATFETNLRHGVKVEVPFEPKQDLHGYDHPWPGGGSANKLEPLFEDGYLDPNTGKETTATSYLRSVNFNKCDANAEYYTAVNVMTFRLLFYDENYEFISSNYNQRAVITTPENAAYFKVYFNKGDYKVGVNYPATATDYVPYENICPIEGYTECEVEHTGKNLLDETAKIKDYLTGTGLYFVPINLPFNTTLTYSDDYGEWRTKGKYLALTTASTPEEFNATTEKISLIDSNSANRDSFTFESFGKQMYLRFFGNALFFDYCTHMQIELGSTATDYEPYQGTTLPISWKHAEGTYEFSPVQEGSGDPSPENVRPIHPGLTITRDDNTELTVYGGSITFNDDGTSSISSKYIMRNAQSSWIFGKQSTTGWYMILSDMPSGFQNSKSYCNVLTKVNSQSSTEFGVVFGYSGANRLVITGSQSLYPNDGELSSYLSEIGACFVYPAASPTIYNLSVTETQSAIEALGDKVTTVIYGGTVTVNEDGSADVVSEWITRSNIDGSYSWTNFVADKAMCQGRFIDDMPDTLDSRGLVVCDSLQTVRNQGAATKDTKYTVAAFGSPWKYMIVQLDPNTIKTLDEFKAYLNENPITVSYKSSSTPTIYHFPNVGKLKAFLGTNNIWSDIGNVNVKYLTQNSETGMEYRGDRALELRRRAMIADAPTIHTTTGSEETGGLASFKSYVKAPVKKIEIPFKPKQDLHGYDHPWPAGGGKNILNTEGTNVENGYVSGKYVTNTGAEINWGEKGYISEYTPIKANTEYTITLGSGGYYSPSIAFYDSEKNFISGNGYQSRRSFSFTTPENAAFYRASIDAVYVNQMMLELGSTATAYEPYSNICPIEGHDGCETKSCRRNLLNTARPYRSIAFNDASRIHSVDELEDGLAAGQMLFYGLDTYVGDTLDFSINTVHVVFKNLPIGTYSAIYTKHVYGITDDLYVEDIPRAINTQTNPTYFEVTKQYKYVMIYCHNYAQSWSQNPYTIDDVVENMMVVKGDTLGDYEPYQGTTLPLIFNQAGDHAFLPIQEGTGDPSPENVRPIHPGLTFTRDDDSVLSVYGGTLTVNADGTGSLVESQVKMTMTEYFAESGHSIEMVNGYLCRLYSLSIITEPIICNTFKAITGKAWSYFVNLTGNECMYGGGYFGLGSSTLGFTTAAEWEAYLKENVEICATLATPITYTLSVAETNRALEALGLTQHIGPLYGGTVTINDDGSADVVADRKTVSDLGALTWYKATENFFSDTLGDAYPVQANDTTVLCSKYKTVTATDGINRHGDTDYCVFQYSGTSRRIVIRDTTYTTVADFKASLGNTQLCYLLATPITYHFSNLEELKVWLGENNFWCDISDDISVKYWNRGFSN